MTAQDFPADVIGTILGRRSIGVLLEPAPASDVLELALECAFAAPDHERLRPTRFILVEGVARETLGRLFAEALRQREPGASAAALEREMKKPLRAPLVIVAACSPVQGKVPEIEQILCVGAAVQNLQLALHAKGFGAIWRTGEVAYDDGVKRGLGLQPADRIVGFVYVGTPGAVPRATDRRPPAGAVRRLAA